MVHFRRLVVSGLALLSFCGVLGAQRAADPSSRYYRLICLVHLTGSGKAGDPIVPEYVVEGTAVAQAAVAATVSAAATATAANSGAVAVAVPAATGATTSPTPVSSPPPMPTTASSRPGYLAWSMQKSDDGTMAILHIVAADHHAFDSILADKRGEIRVFEIGKDSKTKIEAEMQKYKKNFTLAGFPVVVQ